ncbi:ATP-grasp fold amidoligase family protein [Serratia sp. BFP-2025]|uniref:ATP-grasp fold amidoligase family protein n=1 Tax=Serratia sp. BFP-2025 TaxID=3433707 RepID=UPI003D7ED7F3
MNSWLVLVKEYLFRRVKRILHFAPWRIQDCLVFFYYFRRFPRLRNPISFNEKVLYRKSRQFELSAFSILADKYKVRQYISDTIGNEFLVPLLFHSKHPIKPCDLRFGCDVIIKPNHCAGMYVVIPEIADDFFLDRICSEVNKWLSIDFSQVQRERHYSKISPKILVEKLLGDGFKAPIDYKFHIFNNANGNTNYVLQVIDDRFSGKIRRTFYVNSLETVFCKEKGEEGVPVCSNLLACALSKSLTLAAKFDYVRVDWYIHSGNLYFGEMTFTPAAGFGIGFGDELDNVMGHFWSMSSLDQLRASTIGLERYN